MALERATQGAECYHCGVYVGYTEVVPPEVVWSTIEHKMAKKPKLLPLNKEAFEKGLAIGREQK